MSLVSDRRTAPTVTQRVAGAASRVVAPRRPGRRSFLQRAALVATALVVDPVGFVLRPQTAWASVCGPANECSQGWTAMCCTINGGANTCPPGSYAAGWWKVSSSAFCNGGDRYVVDCNRTPSAQCECRCADGECDRRRVCCNNFRYGQCHQEVPGTTEVVCRVVICTPPWEWDETCTTTVRTDERTRDHNASCLNPPDPTDIAITYQDIGLVGSVVGAPVAEESALPDGGAWRAYEDGVLVQPPGGSVQVVAGPVGVAYRDRGGPGAGLGYPTGPAEAVTGGARLPVEAGVLYAGAEGMSGWLHGPVAAAYDQRGGASDWLGLPISDVLEAPGGRVRADFASGWSLVHDPSVPETRLLPATVEVSSSAGRWPSTASVRRLSGQDRVGTAAVVAADVHPDGAALVVLAAAEAFPDALAGGSLAAAGGGPVLLVGGSALPAATADALERLGPDRVVVVGGAGVVADGVLDEVRELLPDASVVRVAGDSRIATALAVAEEVVGEDPVEVAFVASAQDFPDALSASPAAGRLGAPLLLTEPDRLPAAVGEALERFAPSRVVLVGGTAALTAQVADDVQRAVDGSVERVAGPGRHDTAAAMAAAFGPDRPDRVLVATGDGFADALSAGAAAGGTTGVQLLLASRDGVPAVTRAAIADLRPEELVMVGGPAALSPAVAEQLAATPTEQTTPREPGQGEQATPPPLPARR